MIDIHCHILPGVDDGAQDIQETKRMLQIAWEEGIDTMIATPHYRHRYIENTAECLQERLEMARKAARRISPEFRIYLGNEIYYSHESAEALQSGRAFSMADSRYVLTEFSTGKPYQEIEAALREFQMNGFQPIIAHAERYECLLEEPGRVEDLVDMGAYVQVNAKTVTGGNGRSGKSFVKKLLKYELVHFIGTDAHGIRQRAPEMKKCYTYLKRKIGEARAEELCGGNAWKILQKEDL